MNKDLVKYALIAVAAYLVYEYIQKNGGLQAMFGTPALPGAAPPAPAPTTTTTQSAAPPSGVATANLKSKVAAAAGFGVTQLTMDQWCYYLSQISGYSCPDPTSLFPGMDRSHTMDIDTFWAGIGPWLKTSGLGMFAPAYQAAAWLN